MLIALIDDGINAAVCPEVNIQYDFVVDKDGTVADRSIHDSILTDHGTTCAKIIAKYATNATFCSLRIFDAVAIDDTGKAGLRTSCERLAAALTWCCNARIPLVHISAGTNLLSDQAKIRPIIARMIWQRQIIVAACSNRDEYSIPSCLGGVLGVVANSDMANNEYRIVYGRDGCHEIRASSRHTLSFHFGENFVTHVSNSYAAPTITAAVYNVLLKHEPCTLSVSQVFRLLAVKTLTPRWAMPDFIQDAYIINPSGERPLKKHLFFNCREEYATIEEWKRNATLNLDLVYLNSEDHCSVEVFSYLYKYKDMYAGLLFGGIVPRGITLAQSNMVWSENTYYDRYQQSDNDQSNTDCPIIRIYGKSFVALDLLCHLKNLFFQDGYECACVSNAPFAYLYGVEYVPNEIDSTRVEEYVRRKYRPDILLVGISAQGKSNTQFSGKCAVVLSDGIRNSKTIQWHAPNSSIREDSLLPLYDEIKLFFE